MRETNIVDHNGRPCMSDERLFGLIGRTLRRLTPKRQVLLSKAMPPAPKPLPAKKANSLPSAQQLALLIDRAVTGGLMSGHDGLQALDLLKQGKPLPAGVLVALGVNHGQ